MEIKFKKYATLWYKLKDIYFIDDSQEPSRNLKENDNLINKKVLHGLESALGILQCNYNFFSGNKAHTFLKFFPPFSLSSMHLKYFMYI